MAKKNNKEEVVLNDVALEEPEAIEEEARNPVEERKAKYAKKEPFNSEQYWNELVPVNLFKDGNRYKDDVFVSVNNGRIQVQRGKTVMVPRKYAKVLERQMKQDNRTAELIERESGSFAIRSKEYGY